MIRCICGYSEDDGFTIQCEKCNAWQHAVCVNIENDKVPDVYLCDLCGKLKYDAEAARKYQERRLAAASAHASLLKLQEDERQKRRNNDRKRSATEDAGSDGEGDDLHVEKRRRSREEDRRNNTEKGPSAGASPRAPSSRSSPAPSSGSSSNFSTAPRRGRGKRLVVSNAIARDDKYLESEPERKFTLDQMYNSYFVPISQYRYSIPDVRQFVESLATSSEGNITHFTTQEYDSIKSLELCVKLTSDHPKQKFSGFSRFGLFLEQSISRDRFIVAYFGEVKTKVQYKSNTINQYRQFGCPKPGVLFHPTLSICIDGRLVGSQARFIRRSCTPNCKVSTVVVENQKVVFAIFSTETIKAGTELTLAWEWDANHPARKLIEDIPCEKLSKEERTFLVHAASMIIQRGAECACSLGNDCLLAKMKRANGTPPRNTRIGSKSRRTVGDGALDSVDSDNGGGIYGTEASDNAIFYSTREARKLQSAMEMIERLNRNEGSKRGQQNGNTDISKSKCLQAPEQPSKPNTADKSVQTLPMSIPLRHNGFGVKQPEIDSRCIYSSARMQSRKRALHQYLQAKQAYTEALPKGLKMRPIDIPYIDPQNTIPLRSSTSSPLPSKSINVGIPTRVPSAGKPTTYCNGVNSTPNVSVPSSPHLPHNDSFPVSRIPSKPPTPVPGSPLTTPVATPTFESPSMIPPSIEKPAAPLIPSAAPSKTVKKLSFADYKKKKTSTTALAASATQQQPK